METTASTAAGAAIRLVAMFRIPLCMKMALAASMLYVSADAQRPIGEVQSGDAAMRGSVVLTKTGTRVMSGTQISAGSSTAVLKLSRGGEMQICPNASVTLSSSNSGAENLVALNAGAI